MKNDTRMQAVRQPRGDAAPLPQRSMTVHKHGLR